MRHVITLSTIPPRFDKIGPVLQSLVGQKSRPEAVELYIPRSYRRFPQWGGGLPDVPQGVTIVRVDEDLGPATKILPAARSRRGQDIELLYVDDDWVYPDFWSQESLALRKAHPRTAICSAGFEIKRFYGYPHTGSEFPRAAHSPAPSRQLGYQLRRLMVALRRQDRSDLSLALEASRFERSGYIDIGEGFGGVMVRPDFFDDLFFAIPPVVWAVDDIWLSGMLLRRGIPTWASREIWRKRRLLDVSRHFALGTAVIDGADRHAANRACIDYMRQTYGIWGGVATIST